MGRQAEERVRSVALIAAARIKGVCPWPRIATLVAAVITTACSGAPSDLASTDAATSDAAQPTDAPTTADAASAADASVHDAPTADATSTDASPTDAAPSPANPFSITLTDVTDAMAPTYLGGRRSDNGWGHGSGVAVGDVDGDGRDDLVLARCDAPAPAPAGGPSVLLKQLPAMDGVPRFTEDTAFAAAFAGTCAHGAAFGDFDGDGDLDLFVALEGADRLLRNDGTGNFTDVTLAAGLSGPATDATGGAVWADLNSDGLLDLFVISHARVLPPEPDPQNRNRLYINRGDGTFDEIGDTAGLASNGASQAAAIADLDGDGDLEIYVANDAFAVDGQGGIEDLAADVWLDPIAIDANGRPSFVDRSAAFGIDGPRSAMGVSLPDLDRDGRLDIYVSDWGFNYLQVWDEGAGGYAQAAADWGLYLRTDPNGYRYVSWGSRFVDLDRDGSEELFLVNGSVTEPINCHSLAQLDLFLRRAPGQDVFENITSDVGLPDVQPCATADLGRPYSGRGLAFADLDGDGDDDLIVAPFVEAFRFYRNDTPDTGHHFLRVVLRGTVSAPDPVGATLVVTDATGSTRSVQLTTGGLPNSQSSRILEVGLGAVANVSQVWVYWPSGYRQRIDALAGFAIDETITVVEPTWLRLTARTAAIMEPAPTLTYQAVDDMGVPLGAAGAGRAVTATRSDGVAVTITDNGDGTYSAELPHPGAPRTTVVQLTVDGTTARVRPTITFR